MCVRRVASVQVSLKWTEKMCTHLTKHQQQQTPLRIKIIACCLLLRKTGTNTHTGNEKEEKGGERIFIADNYLQTRRMCVCVRIFIIIFHLENSSSGGGGGGGRAANQLFRVEPTTIFTAWRCCCCSDE